MRGAGRRQAASAPPGHGSPSWPLTGLALVLAVLVVGVLLAGRSAPSLAAAFISARARPFAALRSSPKVPSELLQPARIAARAIVRGTAADIGVASAGGKGHHRPHDPAPLGPPGGQRRLRQLLVQLREESGFLNI